MNRLTKRQLRTLLEFDTDVEVAAFFEISASAVSQWGEDQPIPELRQLQAERKRPDLFGPDARPDDPHRPGAANDTESGAQPETAGNPVRSLSEAA